MFDEHDHRTLEELEWSLSTEDPGFVVRFTREQQRMCARIRHRRGARVALVVAVSVGIGLLLLGTPAGAVAAMLTTGLVWLAWRYPNVFQGSPPS